MVDCDYCSESFDGEDAYLDHLADSHEGELGAIDKRRVSGRESDDEGGLSVGILAIGVVVVLTIGVGVYVTQLSGGGGGGSVDGIEGSSLDTNGESSLLASVERFPAPDSVDHLDAGTTIEYAQSPPVSGPHYNLPTEGGYYEEVQPAGNIVHALEHGAVVIYYDPAANGTASGTDDTPEASLREFAATHTGRWRSVVVAPNPSENPESDYVLTAWRTRMYMDSYDAQRVFAFLSEYLGRGPENPVR